MKIYSILNFIEKLIRIQEQKFGFPRNWNKLGPMESYLGKNLDSNKNNL